MSDDDSADVIPPTQTPSDTIQPIKRDTVHRICSGQVVLSLAIAVKELVENSLDAGATIIDIQLKEYGSEVIEVSDNGSGVKRENFQALTLKHYTSKIQQFEDLSSLSTLGFRGEALSSLCALSDLTIFTKHVNSENATKIKYDSRGKIVEESMGARETGTTVTLRNLFSSLPVRRKEFVKNLKREFNKMCQLLYAYCLVSKGVKFSCSNVTSKAARSVVVSTDGLRTVRDNIINVFGAKQISSLIEVDFVRPEADILAEYGIELAEGEPLPFSFECFISSVLHGCGRSATDRQFFYINSRPCEPSKVTKLVNEIYKQYNVNQYPFVFMNIQSRSCMVDVNVTPDKRQVFLEKEKILLATLKASLVEAFKVFPSTFKVQNLELSQNVSIKDFLDGKKKGLKRSLTDSGLKKGSILEKFKKRSKTENDKDDDISLSRNNSDLMLDTFIRIASETKDEKEEEEKKIVKEGQKVETEDEQKQEETKTVIEEEQKVGKTKEEMATNGNEKDSQVERKDKLEYKNKKDNIDIEKVEEIEIVCGNSTSRKPKIATIETAKTADSCKSDRKIEILVTPKKEQKTVSIDSTVRDRENTVTVTLNVTMEDVKKSAMKRMKTDEKDDVKVRFRCKITPEANKSAEEELNKQISKADFAEMSIIGQFNLGFIIARSRNDLFIIDQHATDEKYNFEQLQANTVMENQILVNPRPLELTAGNESLLIENEDIFKKNGFTFKIDHSAPCTKKVFLTSVPLSRNVIFGKDDIDEMLFMLRDSNHTMCRPSRIRAMFASRACRKSVMIGKSLSKSDMKKLINHMGEIEQPWNCPHGRPTMRHLINLDLIHTEEL